MKLHLIDSYWPINNLLAIEKIIEDYMQTCINESVEYLIEIMNVIDDKHWMANNLLNHKEAVHKGISTFNNNKANKTVDLNIDKEDEDKDKPIPDKNNSVNDFLNHYNSSEICTKEWGALGSFQLYELPSVREANSFEDGRIMLQVWGLVPWSLQ